MSGFSVDYDDSEARKHVDRVAALLVDLRPFYPKVVPIFVSWMSRQFDTEGAFAGHPWEPLSSSYASWKSIAHPGKGILVASGQLRRAASNPIRKATPTTLTLTIDDSGSEHGPVLQFHETGAGNMPARPLLFGDPLPAAAGAMLDKAASEFVDDWLRRIP